MTTCYCVLALLLLYCRLYNSVNCIIVLSDMISGYITDVLDDAKVYASHANKKNIDADDVKLAVQCRMDHSLTNPPPRDVCVF